MKTTTYGRWWLAERRLEEGDDGTTHDDECCDHRHFVSELNLGWRFWTPAGRLETIERMEPVDTSEYWWRIWTKDTGPHWSWRRRRDDRVHAIRPNPTAVAHLRFVDLAKGRTGASMHIVPAETYDIPDFALALAEAKYLGDGAGWRMTDRPDGGDQITTQYPSKAKARTALLRAGRTHAKILGLPLYSEDDLARHF